MRHFFLSLCISGFFSNIYAIGAYSPKDTLYVWAYNGLVLRSKPDPKASPIASIAYGNAMVVVSKNPQWAHQIQEYGDFKLHGHWVEVRYQDSLQGYVFDGYLSLFPARTYPRKTEEFEELLQYFETIWGPGKGTRLDYIKKVKRAYTDIPLHVYVQTSQKVTMQYEVTTFIFEKKAGKILMKYWSSC